MEARRFYAGLVALLSILQWASGRSHFRVSMPSVVPQEDDNYLCMAYPVSDLVKVSIGLFCVTAVELFASRLSDLLRHGCRTYCVTSVGLIASRLSDFLRQYCRTFASQLSDFLRHSCLTFCVTAV
jgi:hypothetical protein